MPNKGASLGKAPALSPKWWTLWLNHILEEAGSRMFFVFWLTNALAARGGEVVELKNGKKDCDFCLEGTPQDDCATVQIRGGKSPGPVYVRPEYEKDLKDILKNGVKSVLSLIHI